VHEPKFKIGQEEETLLQFAGKHRIAAKHPKRRALTFTGRRINLKGKGKKLKIGGQE